MKTYADLSIRQLKFLAVLDTLGENIHIDILDVLVY